MDLAKDLAWQKIFRGRSTNSKIEKSVFFCIFATLTPYFIPFPIRSERIKLQPKILILRGWKNKKFFSSDFFLALISSLTRKVRSFWSDNELCERSNEQWTRSSLSDRKERNFRMRLEIKAKKKLEKKNFIFFSTS